LLIAKFGVASWHSARNVDQDRVLHGDERTLLARKARVEVVRSPRSMARSAMSVVTFRGPQDIKSPADVERYLAELDKERGPIGRITSEEIASRSSFGRW
jgi:hypothetical protein